MQGFWRGAAGHHGSVGTTVLEPNLPTQVSVQSLWMQILFNSKRIRCASPRRLAPWSHASGAASARNLSVAAPHLPPVNWSSPYRTIGASPAILRIIRHGPRLFFSPAIAPTTTTSIRQTGTGSSSSLLRSPQSRSFSSAIMIAEKIDGTAIAKRIRERINKDIAEKQKANPRFKPSLIIIQGTWAVRCWWPAFCAHR